ncbi:hypothetical protein F2P81_019662 [Scophthalmus maximus]|uniref:Uncharacterized protein n=1 Tax=Scophthalmus maximus TaxID=52904 RepID=A0A6A4S8E6_SCOMX|nr:hypothetical protein F2P81_019662 [Scophthalmus maximus]
MLRILLSGVIVPTTLPDLGVESCQVATVTEGQTAAMRRDRPIKGERDKEQEGEDERKRYRLSLSLSPPATLTDKQRMKIVTEREQREVAAQERRSCVHRPPDVA